MCSDLENILYVHGKCMHVQVYIYMHGQMIEAHFSQVNSLGQFSGQYLEAFTEASVGGNNTEIISSQSQNGAANAGQTSNLRPPSRFIVTITFPNESQLTLH